MRKKMTAALGVFLLTALMTTACGGNDSADAGAVQTDAIYDADASADVEESEAAGDAAPDRYDETRDADSDAINMTDVSDSEGTTGNIASAEDMVTPEEVVEEGMEPVYADALKEGCYEVTVDSSSSMFKIVSCELTVADGEMSAVMTMGGTGYAYVYMGTGGEAAAAAEQDYIQPEENADGAHTFTVPVEALDMGIDCAAFSRKKEMWYDRTILFRADSLPLAAFEESGVVTAESLGLSDGAYKVEVALEGGSGRASVESPAQLTVEGGNAYVVIVFSSPNYDYMKVDDVQYDTANRELGLQGNSAFCIPVGAFDRKLAVKADTVAMSEPHEIDYTLYFDSSTITAE